MCGIAGFCSFEQDYRERQPERQALLRRMRTALRRRGADQTGEYLRAHVGLAHTRLSIRDVALGAQPMVRRADGAEYAIVYNGEIYNAGELKARLAAEGCRFETSCDTEVVLYGFMRWGPAVAEQLNGIFAFAVWDGARQQLWLFRDRVGVKPLFYARRGAELIFASEPKALFCHPAVTPAIDLDSLRQVLAIGPARTAGSGVFCGVQELKAGCRAVFDAAGFREWRYWEVKSEPFTDSYETAVQTVSRLVRDAVRRQLVSDVPVCSFLSGGVDSSIVTALAAAGLAQDGATLNTFSFDFAGNDRWFAANSFQPERDQPYVERMLQTVDTRHTCLYCDEARLADLLDAAMEARDLPGMADVDASLLYFCAQVAQSNKVALTGECADEIFGGYPWFYREELVNTDGFPWARDMGARTLLLTDEAADQLRLDEYAHARYAESVACTPRLEGGSPFEVRRRQIAYLNLKWFMPTLLDRMDRTSMYSGLEARVPFADHRIIEYVWNVPFAMKRQNGVEKSLLRDACADLLPPELLHRKKSPYPKTYDPRYEKLLCRRLREILADPSSPILAFTDRAKAEAFMQAPAQTGRPWFGQLMAGPQLIAYYIQLNSWMRRYSLHV